MRLLHYQESKYFVSSAGSANYEKYDEVQKKINQLGAMSGYRGY